ncbi:MAG: hypothetical protein IKB15_07235 [Alistipes sp.]|nr:hypothetical protein [Alistipes sp.]
MRKFLFVLLPMLALSVTVTAQIPKSNKAKAYVLCAVGENERPVSSDEVEYLFVAFGDENIGLCFVDDTDKQIKKHLTKNPAHYGNKAVKKCEGDARRWKNKTPELDFSLSAGLNADTIEILRYNSELSENGFSVYRECSTTMKKELRMTETEVVWSEPKWGSMCYMFMGAGDDLWILRYDNPSSSKHYRLTSVDEILSNL